MDGFVSVVKNAYVSSTGFKFLDQYLLRRPEDFADALEFYEADGIWGNDQPVWPVSLPQSIQLSDLPFKKLGRVYELLFGLSFLRLPSHISTGTVRRWTS